jgi:hypothetical protein
MNINHSDLSKVSIVTFLLGLAVILFVPSSAYKDLFTNVIGLVLMLFLVMEWLIKSISFIISGHKSGDSGPVFLGTMFLIFPIICLIIFFSSFLDIENYGNLILVLALFAIGISILIMTDYPPARGDNFFKISYFIILMALVMFWIGDINSRKPVHYHGSAKVKATMDQMRSAAELFKINNNQGTYFGITEEGDTSVLVNEVNRILKTDNNILISPDGMAWCFKVDLSGKNGKMQMFCVDSDGYSGEPTNTSSDCNLRNNDYDCR